MSVSQRGSQFYFSKPENRTQRLKSKSLAGPQLYPLIQKEQGKKKKNQESKQHTNVSPK